MLSISQQPTPEQIRQVEQAKKEVKRMHGQAFPTFRLTTMNGESVSSENTQGKIIVFSFWFSRCRPCIDEMPELNQLVTEFTNHEILFLAPTFDSELEVRNFLRRFDFDYQIIPDEKAFCLTLNVRSFPTHFIVDQAGIIEKVITGYSHSTVSSIRKILKKLLHSQ